MAVITSTQRSGDTFSIRSYVANHQLGSFFVVAFVGAWLAFLPPLLAQNSLGVLPFRLPLALFLALGSFTGPALSAILVAWASGGKEGVWNLLRRYTIRPKRYWWFILALFGPLEALLLGSSAFLGSGPLDAIRQQPTLFLSSYLGFLISGLLFGPLGEELGWRGFALPGLQKGVLGPLWGSLLLGLFWASWHLPLLFFPEWTGSGDVLVLAAAFFSWVIPFTIFMTWVYNCSRGSLTVATLMHGAENAAVGLIPAHLLLIPSDLFFQAKVYGVLALFLIIATRGKLGVGSFREPEEIPSDSLDAPRQKGLSRRQIVIGVVLGIITLYILVNLGYDLIHGTK